jgi:RimJ/RimL family protein N-acetyltransferase
MIDPALFRDRPTLSTGNLRLEPLGSDHVAGLWAAHNDAEARRLTGTHEQLTEQQVAERVSGRVAADDRIDWAIVRESDGEFLGEAMLRGIDPHNESAEFYIALGNSKIFGKGYGSEASKAVIDFAIDVVKLHRITLEVVDFNTRAQRIYSKIGFHQEGLLREAWYWDGEWSDVIGMALLSEH